VSIFLPIQWIPAALSSGSKHPFRDVTTHPSTGIKNEWSYTSTLPHEFKASKGTLLFTIQYLEILINLLLTWAVECFLTQTVVPESIASMQHTYHPSLATRALTQSTCHTVHLDIPRSGNSIEVLLLYFTNGLLSSSVSIVTRF